MEDLEKSDGLIAIGEVSKLTSLPISTLRFYENEFATYLQVVKTSGGHRRFCPDAIEKLKYIHDLIHLKKKSLKDVKSALISDKDPVLLRRDVDLLLEVHESLIQENVRLKSALEDLGRRVLQLEEERERGKKRFKLF
jgi:DNA-binding transcriptional MerR regulator